MKTATDQKATSLETVQSSLLNMGLLDGLSSAQFNDFLQQAVQKTYPKGFVLFAQGDEAEAFYLITRGWVKLYRETLDGEEAVVDVLTAGHLFGETAIFEEDGYGMSAEVVEEAEIVSLPLGLLKQLMAESPQLSMNMLKTMSRFRRQQDMELEHRTLQNASQRIGCFLLRLCKPDAKSPIRLNLPYDKTLIASRLGMKPETFSRALARLREDTGIRIQGATVEIDGLNQLSGYSCSTCSSSYPCKDL